MKNLIIIMGIICIVQILPSCDNKSVDDKSEENALLPKVVLLKHNFYFNQQTGGQDWSGGFDSKKFIDKILDDVLAGKVIVFDYGDFCENIYSPMTSDVINWSCDVLSRDTFLVEDPASGELIEKITEFKLDRKDVILTHFWEEWFFNEEKFSLDKEVIGYGLAREYERQMADGEIDVAKRMMFMIPFKTDSINILAKNVKEKELIAENIKYEFNLDEQESFVKGFDRELFFNLLMKKVKNDATVLEDFFDSATKFSYREYEKNNLIDTFIIENPITFELIPKIVNSEIDFETIQSYIFIEDWYIDWKTLKIVKIIKGIAPVMHFYRADDTEGTRETQKKVLFTIWFNYQK
ncbi:MAG: hypothetical protein ABIJ97_02860 [Bacteroidota bacterium]